MQEEMRCCRNSSKGTFEKEENGDGEKKSEEEEMCRNLSPLHSSNWFKEREKVKSKIFLTLGEKLPNSAPTSPNHPY